MKRKADTGKQHGKQAGTATSVQPFAGSIMSKYKGGSKDSFGRISLSHRLKQQEDAPTEHRIFVKVIAPAEKKEPKQLGRAALPVIQPKPQAEKIIREKVIVERERIIFRDLSRIIQESRMIRETAVTQQAEVKRSTSQQTKDTAVVIQKKTESGEGQQSLAHSQGFRVKRLTTSGRQELVTIARPMIVKINHPIQKTDEQSGSSSSNRDFNRWKTNAELQTLIDKVKRMSYPSKKRSRTKLEHLLKQEQMIRVHQAAIGQKNDASSFQPEHGGRKAAETGEGQSKRPELSIAEKAGSSKNERMDGKQSKSVERSNKLERGNKTGNGEAADSFYAKKRMRARAVIAQAKAVQPHKSTEQVHAKPGRPEQAEKEKDANGSSKQLTVVQVRAGHTIANERASSSSRTSSVHSAESANRTNSKESKKTEAVMRANVTGPNATKQVHIKSNAAGQTESAASGQATVESKSSGEREHGQAGIMKPVSLTPLTKTVHLSEAALQSGAEEKATNGVTVQMHVAQPQKTVEQVHVKPSQAWQAEAIEDKQAKAGQAESGSSERLKTESASSENRVRSGVKSDTADMSDVAEQQGTEATRSMQARVIARVNAAEPQQAAMQVHAKPGGAESAATVGSGQTSAIPATTAQVKSAEQLEESIRGNAVQLTNMTEDQTDIKQSMQVRATVQAKEAVVQRAAEQVHAKPSEVRQAEAVEGERAKAGQAGTGERAGATARANEAAQPQKAAEQVHAKPSGVRQAEAVEGERAKAGQAGTGERAGATARANAAEPQKAAEQIHAKPSAVRQAKAVEGERAKAGQVSTGERAGAIARVNAAAEPQKAAEQVHAKPSGVRQARAIAGERAKAAQAGTGERDGATARANEAAEPQKGAEQVHAKPSAVRQAKAVEGERAKAGQAGTGERAGATARANAAAEPQKAAEQVHAKPSGVRQARAIAGERAKAAQPLHTFVLKRHNVRGNVTATSGPTGQDNSQPANPMLSYAGTGSSASPAGGPMPALAHPKAKTTAKEPERIVQVDAPKELDPEKLQKIIMQMPQLNPEAIADKVYLALERKMKLEQRRRGI